MKKMVLGLAALVACAAVAAGCGSSGDSSSGSGSGSGAENLNVTWLYYADLDDGGYNVAMKASQDAAAEATGAGSREIAQLDFNGRASQAAEQAIASGSNVLVDTMGLGDLFSQDVCAKHVDDVTCLATADPSKLPENTRNYWIQDWNGNYVAGVAAGLMTKTNTVGFIGAYKIPIIVQAANAYQMGCESVNPQCKTRIIISNQYFDPPTNNKAASTLIDAGADVLRNWIDDPGFCQVAQDRGVYAVGQFYDLHGACPDSIITSTEWSFTDYMTDQYKKIADGSFKCCETDLVPFGHGDGEPHLGDWGDFVPADVQKKVEDVYDQIVDGKDVMVGPVYDQDGQLMFKEGEKIPEDFMWKKWDWYVQGTIGG